MTEPQTDTGRRLVSPPGEPGSFHVHVPLDTVLAVESEMRAIVLVELREDFQNAIAKMPNGPLWEAAQATMKSAVKHLLAD